MNAEELKASLKEDTKMDNNEIQHRMTMIQDDLNAIKRFIKDKGLTELFAQSSSYSFECWHHFNNIEIASDLNDKECLNWKPYSKI